MKRKILFLISLLLMAAMLVSCKGLPAEPAEQTTPDAPSNIGAVTSLTGAEAKEIAQAWLDEHPDMVTPYEPTTITGISDEMFVYDSDEYYCFNLGGYYWLDILVHSETGRLLCIQTEESDEPTDPVIEPLDDYYNRFYGD